MRSLLEHSKIKINNKNINTFVFDFALLHHCICICLSACVYVCLSRHPPPPHIFTLIVQWINGTVVLIPYSVWSDFYLCFVFFEMREEKTDKTKNKQENTYFINICWHIFRIDIITPVCKCTHYTDTYIMIQKHTTVMKCFFSCIRVTPKRMF